MIRVHVLLICLLVWGAGPALPAQAQISRIDGSHTWTSPNVRQIGETAPVQSLDLGGLAYHRHFDQNGRPPGWPFLRPLIQDASAVATINGHEIKFKRTGITQRIEPGKIPASSSPAKPYLLTTRDKSWILAVLPYYFAQCKDNDYLVWVFNADGELLHLWPSLPSHSLTGSPEVLVAAEKTGCCESLRFSFRFYGLKSGEIREYSCPEGYCGDVLFEELTPGGPLVVGLEYLAGLQGVGAAILTRLEIVNRQGGPIASCAFLHGSRQEFSSLHQFRLKASRSLASLQGLAPDPDGIGSWRVSFHEEGQLRQYRFQGIPRQRPPIVLLASSNRQSKEGAGKIHPVGFSAPMDIPVMLMIPPGSAPLVYLSSTGEKQNMDISTANSPVQIWMLD